MMTSFALKSINETRNNSLDTNDDDKDNENTDDEASVNVGNTGGLSKSSRVIAVTDRQIKKQ